MIFWNELKKYGKNKMFLFALIALLAIVGVSFGYFNNQNSFAPKQYKAVYQELKEKNVDEVKAFCENEKAKYEFYSLYEIQGGEQSFLNTYTEQYGQDWVSQRIEEYQTIEKNEIYPHITVMERILQEAESVQSYEEYREQIQEQYQTNQKISIFQSQDDYNTRSAEKTSKIYEELQLNGEMKLQQTLGLEQVLKFSFRDIAGVLFLLYCVGLGILQEKKRGMLSFLQVTYKGRKKLYSRKIAGIIVCAAVWEIASFLVCFLIGQMQFGWMDFSYAVQSVEMLMQSPYGISIGIFIAGYLAIRVFVYAGLGILLAAFGFVSGSFISVSALGAVLVGVGAGLYEQISDISQFSFIKRCNVWQLMRAEDFLGDYTYIRIGNEPISINWSIGILLAVLIGAYFIGKFFFAKDRKKVKKSRSKARKKTPHSILYYEMKKLWIQNWGIVIFAAAILIQAVMTFQAVPYQTVDDFYYNAYVDQIGDRVTDEARAKLEQEENRFLELQQQIGSETDENRILYLESKMRAYNAFEQYREKFYEIADIGEHLQLVKESQYRFLLDNEKEMQKTILLLFCTMLFIVPGIYQREKETRVETLQKTVRYGKGKLWRAKLIAGASFILPVTAILFSTLLIKTYQEFPGFDIWVSLDSVEKYWMTGIKMPVVMFWVITFVIRLCVVLAIFIAEMWLAKKMKNRYNVMFILAVITILSVFAGNFVSARWIYFLQEPIRLINIGNSIELLAYAGVSITVSILFYKGGTRI